jgi:hypothetical protein
MNSSQKAQQEAAKRESIEKSMNVCADGEKRAIKEFDRFSNEINNE